MHSESVIIGYMHIIIESITAEDTKLPIHAHISIG
jgi:hypothetical protein